MAGLDTIPRLPGVPLDPKRIGLWKIGRTIGTGASGRVRIARHAKTGQYAAIKIVSKLSFDPTTPLNCISSTTDYNLVALEREIVVMKLIDHPNIMRLYDVWETSTHMYLILEYVQGGELFEHLCKRGRLPTEEARGYFQQIISAIDYCHRFNIAHRDLKPENILLDEQSNIKIADFGMAAWLTNGMLQTSCGSPHYAAPEVFDSRRYEGSGADIWSCGVILFSLLAGRLPFESDDDDMDALVPKILGAAYDMPQDIDPSAQDLIRKMLVVNPHQRITMPELLQHPFYNLNKPITSYHVPSLENISRPITNGTPIDPDILANLRALWHPTPDEEILGSLKNEEQNWQKGIYHLLVDYRNRHSEDYHEEEKLAEARRQKRKQKRQQQTLFAVSSNSTIVRVLRQAELPPRDGPPTPRRAVRRSSFANDSPMVPKIQFLPATPTPEKTGHLAPQSADTDIKMQAAWNQIAEDLNTGTKDYPEPFAWSHLPSLGTTLDRSDTASTRPLSIQRKVQPSRARVEADMEDKENVADPSVGTVPKSSLKTGKHGKKAMPSDKRVKIMAPAPFSKLGIRRVSPSSPVPGLPSRSTSISVSPKRRWLGGVFNSKPVAVTFESFYDIYTTRNECRRLLMEMDLRVVLGDAEGLGVLHCRLEDTKHPSVLMATMKAVQFRAEVQRFVHARNEESVSVRVVYEKGSVDTFKEVCKRLSRNWDLDQFVD
ncbi:CAMK/CAMKL/GIN4 protein kinase [Mycena indigotica]|uniref:non-specific serine/threonine protein kinase n=1 Tax=Mycena indigotica TaxID=2126181 RepID=A0A8H6WB10_9AGAR|nr:CAMK/CAMKL/GIN4 protein kinase [Mycena indigotica]KAF7309721.1 CAMK/CAMKL/GIN4 protein kinase [Mycena indigotica]